MRFFFKRVFPFHSRLWNQILKWVSVLGWAVTVCAQTEEIPSALIPIKAENNVVQQQDFLKFISGKSAAAYGFSSIAERIFKDLLENSEDLDDETSREVRYQLILSLLNQGKLSEAHVVLEGFEDHRSDEYSLVSLLVSYVDNEPTSILENKLLALAGADLGPDQVWIDVMRGILLTRKGQTKEARSVLDAALEKAVSTFQRSWIETLIWREEILHGDANESLLFSLKSQIDNAVNPLIASQLTQQYAIALHAMSNDAEAIRVIERQLPILGVEYREQKDRLLMLLAILSGRNSGKTQVAVEEILLRGKSQRIRSMAFYFWLSNVDFSNENETRTLNQLFESQPTDPLRNEIAYALALSSFYKGNLNQSQARIDSVLESSAESSLKQSALRVLIAVCWSQNPSPNTDWQQNICFDCGA